ncbi:MAG: DUF3108 domain-containing protein [Gemmatimonadaceae bacterium]
MKPIRSMLALGASLLATAPDALQAQNGTRPPVPFGVGESLVYDVKYGPLTVGTGKMEVTGIDTVRGRATYLLRLEVRAGIPGFRVVNILQSWLDVHTLESLRYRQETSQGGKEERRQVEFFPDRRRYQETDWRRSKDEPNGLREIRKPDAESVEHPLDQASFLFFARTQPLDPGNTYSFTRYYKPPNNPVTLAVLRREKANVPAGTFATVVVRPIFKSNGIFGQNGRAEVWFTDDERRLMVKMETHVAFGSITLLLKEFQGGIVGRH